MEVSIKNQLVYKSQMLSIPEEHAFVDGCSQLDDNLIPWESLVIIDKFYEALDN
jgi:hypothetical protein